MFQHMVKLVSANLRVSESRQSESDASQLIS